ncbi:competence protein [Cryomorphaceae bacterium]|nr:competence protein [Cryomorphaceae bacterium]
MKYAIADGKRVEAIKGLKATCPVCSMEVVARCGKQRIWHWAHLVHRACDSSKENETAWHRMWKDLFPSEWQEVTFKENSEKGYSRADVATSKGLILEFQHSRIEEEERIAREEFYNNMIWVIDGTRLKRDYPKFLKAREEFINLGRPHVFRVDFCSEAFPESWTQSKVPVIFDFLGQRDLEDHSDPRKFLYCLFPGFIGRYFVVAEFSRNAFIKAVINGEWEHRYLRFMNQLEVLREQWRTFTKGL